MALKIRLQKHGSKNHPKYRIVVAESKFPRNGKFIENLGYIHPIDKKYKINMPRAIYWINKGAKPTITTKNLIKKNKTI